MREWEFAGKQHSVPAVAHCAWQAPDGRHAVTLADWTPEPREVTVRDARLGSAPVLSVCIRTNEERRVIGDSVTLPPLSCAVLCSA
ncbi:MAG: hypothetical protein HPY44_09695 [Armatimonadetes bacterium]|nr:hypothetical protein [Armatimonadota bacterium]